MAQQKKSKRKGKKRPKSDPLPDVVLYVMRSIADSRKRGAIR